jgi:hypothetical protein
LTSGIDGAKRADEALEPGVLPDVAARINLHQLKPALANEAFAQRDHGGEDE